MYWWILTSRRWLTARPINVYVIEHTDGLVVFDTGQGRASVTDPHYFPDGVTGVIYERLASFHVNEDETMTAGLERLGYRATDVTTAVISTSTRTTSAASARSPRRTCSSHRTNGARSTAPSPAPVACSAPTSSCPD
jgi:hypothetical protein